MKKIIGLLVCMLMLTIIPISSGIPVDTEIEGQNTDVRTIIITGFILFPRYTNNDFTFYFIRSNEWITITDIDVFSGFVYTSRLGFWGIIRGRATLIE